MDARPTAVPELPGTDFPKFFCAADVARVQRRALRARYRPTTYVRIMVALMLLLWAAQLGEFVPFGLLGTIVIGISVLQLSGAFPSIHSNAEEDALELWEHEQGRNVLGEGTRVRTKIREYFADLRHAKDDPTLTRDTVAALRATYIILCNEARWLQETQQSILRRLRAEDHVDDEDDD